MGRTSKNPSATLEQCQFCEKVFNSKVGANRHRRDVHRVFRRPPKNGQTGIILQPHTSKVCSHADSTQSNPEHLQQLLKSCNNWDFMSPILGHNDVDTAAASEPTWVNNSGSVSSTSNPVSGTGASSTPDSDSVYSGVSPAEDDTTATDALLQEAVKRLEFFKKNENINEICEKLAARHNNN